MATPRIKSKAILIGYNAEGRCVYSEILDLSDCYDGTHVWDSAKPIKRLKLRRVMGYLFDSAGKLQEEFESQFDSKTGTYVSGWAKYADGSEVVHPARS